jgi:hypothetical protein
MTPAAFIQIVLVGGTIASVYYWIYTIWRQNRSKEDFKWWLRTIVPQAIIMAAAAKSFHWY